MIKTLSYDSLLISELRAAIISDEPVKITDESITKAVTLNENLKSLGYTVKAKDIAVLASHDIDGFLDKFKKSIGRVSAQPMYPDFPSQVAEMDEAIFRLHQLCHYFSTYGVEELFGCEVNKGWLPEVPDTEKIVADINLIEAKTIELIPESLKYIVPFKRILSKNERMTDKDKLMIEIILKNEEASKLISGIDKISFKENLIPIFLSVMNSDLEREDKVNILHNLCQHTGDVWKCVEQYLYQKKWSLKTSEKRTIVRLLESYPIQDFRANLIITNKKASKVITLLEFLSFNKMSRSEAHKNAVAELRNGTLRSWQSFMHELIATKDENAISFIGQRPGILLRSINWLLKEGFDKKLIEKSLIERAEALSTQTIISVITHFAVPDDNGELLSQDIVDILMPVLFCKMAQKELPFKNKKVFIDWKDINPEFSMIAKSDEGGYVRSGIAINIPETIKKLRFFVYWNDQNRIDIDLHARATSKDGERIHIGWNGEFNDAGIIFSGDITHSDAAEYIDLDFAAANKANIDNVNFHISSYTRVPFKNIETCFTGLMAVSKLGENVKTKLYNPKNVLWSHNLTTNVTNIHYGSVDVEKRLLVIDAGKRTIDAMYDGNDVMTYSKFNYAVYFELLLNAANATLVDNADEADIILTPYKAETEREVSIMDNNLFMD